MVAFKAYTWDPSGGLVPVSELAVATSISVNSGDVLLDTNGVTMGSGKSITLSGGGTVTGLPSTPSLSSDAASKAYVESYANSVASGLDVKKSVVAATTAALSDTVTYDNGTSGVGATLTSNANAAFQTVDGVTLAAGDRILIKDQADPLQNGIYVLTDEGNITTAPYVLTRATDADTGGASGEVTPGLFCFVEQGSTNADTGWVMSGPDTDVTMGTSELVFTQFSSTGSVTAGAGLTKTGNTLDVVSGNTGIVVNANDITLTLASNSGLEIATGLKIDLDSNSGLALGAGGVKLDFSVLASGAGSFDVANDTLPIYDVSGSASQYIAFSQLASSFAGVGLSAASGVMALALSELSDVAIDVANDSFAIIDASNSDASAKETIADFIAAVAGTGLGASAGVLSVNVDDSTIEITTDTLNVKDGGITAAKLATGAVTALKMALLGTALATDLVSNAAITAPEMKVAVINTANGKAQLFDKTVLSQPAGLFVTDTVGGADVAVDLYTVDGTFLTIPSAARNATTFTVGATVYVDDAGILTTDFASDIEGGTYTCPMGLAVSTTEMILRIGSPFQKAA